MIDDTYDRFMIRSAEGRRRTISEYDDETVNDDNPLFGQINHAPICVFLIHGIHTKKRREKKCGAETQYFLEDECKVFRKKTAHVCSYCEDADVVKNKMCVCHNKKTVPVLYSMCIAHLNFSGKYIIDKYYIYIFMPSMQHFFWYKFDDLSVSYSMFST